MIKDILLKLKRSDLEYDEVSKVMDAMLLGNLPDSDIAEFLSGLASKPETDDELLCMLDKMQEFAVKVDLEPASSAIDMCGTGGDGLQTFNISTCASFIVAAAGGVVAKHGNRSSSGMSGSADIFERLGCDLNQNQAGVLESLQRHGIAFMFAQKFHPAMRHVATARKQLSMRTAFNLLGPLSNPAGVKSQLVGVSSATLLERIPNMLKRRGAQTVMAVCADNGMDEFSTSCSNSVCILQDGKTATYSVDPQELGLHHSALQDICIKSEKDAVSAFVRVLNGTANRSMTETAALNAAAGLVVAGIADDLKSGVEMALNTISDGRSLGLLERFVADAGDPAILREAA